MTPLRRARLARKLTLKQLSAAVGLDAGNLSRIEAGQQRSVEAAAKLAQFFAAEGLNELQILYPERYSQTGEGQPA